MRARTSSDLTAGTEVPSACGELDIGHPAQLAHQERRALLLGQPANIGDQPPQRFALIGLRDGILAGCADHAENLGGRHQRTAELVDAAVVGDAIQPGSQRDLAVVRPQARIGPHEHVLEGVLGILAAREHLARIGEQPLPVAIVDGPERVVVPRAEERNELLVRAQPKQRRTNRRPAAG